MKNEFHANYKYENNILAKKKKKTKITTPNYNMSTISEVPKKKKVSHLFLFSTNKTKVKLHNHPLRFGSVANKPPRILILQYNHYDF
jgi:hypothetical protein